MKKTLIWYRGEKESSSEVMSWMLNQALQFMLMNHQTDTNLRSICEHMHNLLVLDLFETNIEVLPASVSNMVNLRGLYVVSRKMPVDLLGEIGALKKLEVLHVSVGSLPLEVRQLTRFHRLWVKFNRGKKEAMRTICANGAIRTICANGVISSMFLLEDLRIYFEDDDFYLRREWCKLEDVSRVAEEVGRLKRLTRLEFDFSRIECLEYFLLEQQRNTNSFPGLKDFHLSMMSGSDGIGFRDFGQEMEKTLMWNKGERESSSEVMSPMGNQVPRFELINHKTATSLLGLGMENIQRLEYCKVRVCPAMKTIVESNSPSTSINVIALLNLKELELIDLPNLRSICEDPCHIFTKLTKLYIFICPKMLCVFTQGMIQHMPNLEQLDVWECKGIEEIVREDVEINHDLQLFFPKLRKLKLSRLEKLVRIWKGAS